MSNIFIINAHQEYPFSKGTLNASLVEKAKEILLPKGHAIRTVTMKDKIDVNQQLENFVWADAVLLQTPLNWMGISWSFKKYMDDIFSAGMMGKLCMYDGRTEAEPKKGYGTGGRMTGKKYMLSLTLNAPEESFNDPNEYLFKGASLDDLMLPMHANFRFFDMTAIPTFACYDVMKNPNIENDFKRFEQHLNTHF